jgi:hypothetical protein
VAVLSQKQRSDAATTDFTNGNQRKKSHITCLATVEDSTVHALQGVILGPIGSGVSVSTSWIYPQEGAMVKVLGKKNMELFI